MPLTYANIETRVMNQLRIPTSNTTEATKIQALINEVYRDIAMKADWWWLVKREVINTADDISTGTVAVTAGSTSITFSTGPTPSVAGRKLYVIGNTQDWEAMYRIATHTAGATAATLDAAYTGATDAAASYRVYQDTYSLATDFQTLLYVTRFGYSNRLELVGPEDMQQLKQWDTSVGKPEIVTVHDFASTGVPTGARQLIVHPYPDNTYRLEVNYRRTLNTELSGSTEPLIPDDYRHVLVYGALARGYPIFLNDSERGQQFTALFNDVVTLMTAIQRERTGQKPQITPGDDYRGFYRRSLNRRQALAAKYNLGSYFDRL